MAVKRRGRFFGGVFKVLIPDNMSTVVAHADSVNPRFTVGWLEYAPGPRVPSPTRPGWPTRRTNRASSGWSSTCATTSSPGKSSPTSPTPKTAPRCGAPRKPACASTAPPAPSRRWCSPSGKPHCCSSRPPVPYAVPVYAEVKVAPRLPRSVGQGIVFDSRTTLRGQTISARADGELAKFFHRGQLVKTHPRQPAGARITDPADLPADKTGYAMRDLHRLIATAAGHGPNIGIYAERLLDHDLPWTKMRQVYRLLGLVKRYGPDPARHRLRPGPGPRRRLGDQDRRHARTGHREPPNRRRRGPRPGWPRPGSPAIPATTAHHTPATPGRTGCASSTAAPLRARVKRDL